MSLVRSTRLLLKHVRRFIAGFASVPTLALGKMKNFPFADNRFALEQDKREIISDRDLAIFKQQKQNDRK